MTIEEVLARLRVQKHASRGRDNRCICPVHDDRTGSLMVKVDDNSGRILMCCHAGCPVDAICDAIGIKQADLNERPLVPGKTVHTTRAKKNTQQTAKTVEKPVEKVVEKPERKLPWPPTKVYHYTDEQGNLIFDVLRFTYPEGDKTFRQGIPDKSKPSGWSLGGVSGLRKPLYRLPEVAAAVAAGRTIYVVEGEKDADTLADMGYTATTNPGGASKPGDKIKWLPEHTQALAGADVVLLPDVDATGLADRQRVGLELLDAGCTVRWIDLRKSGVDMPPKGDISDLAKLVGTAKAMAILEDMVAAARPCTVDDLETDEARRARVEQIYTSEAPGYTIKDGCLARWDPEGGKALCTFMAIPALAVTTDDGITRHGEYVVQCWTASGKRLEDVRVPYADFAGTMRWLDTAWPMQVNVSTGSTVRDNLRQAMTYGGMAMAKRVDMYLHTGWRTIDHRRCYLYHGGAIGADGVQVNLGLDKLARYQMGPGADKAWNEITETNAIMAVSELQQVMPRWVSTPGLAMAFLAPLREVLAECGFPIRHLMYLYGRTGSGKSITSSLLLNFFGHFDGDSFPETFSSSIGHIRQSAFTLKDSLLVIDDYFPTSNAQTKRRMEQMAQDISRMFGDGASREILNSDSSRRASTPPRCICVMTGEYLPDIGESGLQRFYTVRMEGKDVPKNDRLMEVQRKASKGYLRKAMAGYLEWLIPQMDDLGDRLTDRYVEYRARAQQAVKGSHARMPSTVAHMVLGYEMFLRYQMHVLGVDDPAVLAAAMERAWEDILRNTRAQVDEVGDTSPATLFLSTLRDLVISGVAYVRDLDDIESMSRAAPKGLIGYRDTHYYYILPSAAYAAVCEQLRKSGQEFPGNLRSMAQRMKEDDLCVVGRDGQPSKGKSIGGRTVRYFWIPRAIFDGEGSPLRTEQLAIVENDPNDPWREGV